jgi:hypothetical protein
MRCQDCVEKVRLALLNNHISHNLIFDMKSPDKTVEFLGDDNQKNEAIIILKKLGYQAYEIAAEQNKFLTYKPLILIGLYILLATALVEISAASFNFMRAMNIFMGTFFIFFSFFKFLDIKSFADAYTSYDIIAKRIIIYAYFYPLIELSLGVLYILHIWPIMTNIVTIFLMIIGNVGVYKILKSKQVIQCACLGTVFKLPMTKITLFENSLMLLMALISLIYSL